MNHASLRRDFRWHHCDIWPVLIILTFFAVLPFSESCWGKTAPNYGDMTGDYDLPVGSDLVLNCSLTSQEIQIDGFKDRTFHVNSTNLVFKKGTNLVFRKGITSEYIHILDPLTAQLRISNATQNDSGIYHCGLSLPEINKEPVVCSSKVSVGHPPKQIKNFKCISQNMENLTCRWEIEPVGIQTKYTLYKNIVLGTYFQVPSLQRCPDQTSNSTFCQWRYNTDPPYQADEKNLTFVVRGNNSLGNSTDTFNINHYAIVIPNSPDEFDIMERGKTYLTFKWLPPRKLHQMKKRPSLVYQIWIEEMVENAEVKVIDVGKEIINYTIHHLIPYMFYKVSIRCRSSFSIQEDMWSNMTSITAQTLPDVPYVLPEIIDEAFELHQYEDFRSATLYWKPVPRRHFNGKNFYYHIIYFQNTSSENSVIISHYQNSSSPFAEFRKLQKNVPYVFHIHSANSEGISSEYKTLFVNKQKYIVPGPHDITAISHNPAHYELSWAQPKFPDDYTYVVFWCSSLKPWQSRCEGEIHWLNESLTTPSVTLNLTDDTTNFQFAIAAKTSTLNSGMFWASCIVPYQTALGKIDYVVVEPKNSTTLKVIWNLDCPAQKAVVKYFEIVYCKISDINACKVVTAQPNSENFLLRSLQPYSNYSVKIRAFNWANIPSEDSDPRYQATLQGAPSDPPKIISVLPGDNASLHIAWQPPTKPNGIITHYNIFYGNFKAVLEVSPPMQNFYTFTLNGLKYFTNYSIQVEACVQFKECSPKSDSVSAHTQVGVPGFMDPPRIEVVNSNRLKISWKAPFEPNGPINYYNIEWRKEEKNDTSYVKGMQQITIYESLSTVLELECDEFVNNDARYLFFIQAVNIKNGEALYGPFSSSSQAQACTMAQGLAMIIGAAIGGTLALALFLLLVYKLIKWMSDKIHQVKSITVRLPKGLEGPETNPLNNYENFKNGLIQQTQPVNGIRSLSYIVEDSENKNRHGSGSSQHSNSSTDELIYKNGKCTKFGRKPSGESSGCSSMSSTNTAKIHLSSDSGAESESLTSTSPADNVFVDHKAPLPALLEDLSPQQTEFLALQPAKYTNLNEGMVLKVDHPYSKFGIAGNSLIFYSSNLANSEPSVSDIEHLFNGNSSALPPYMKIGLAKSTSNVLDIAHNDKDLGYSKFGLSRQDPLTINNTSQVSIIMVDEPDLSFCHEWNNLKCFKDEKELMHDKYKDKMLSASNSETKGDKEEECPYIKVGKFAPSKTSSPGYVSFNEVKSQPVSDFTPKTDEIISPIPILSSTQNDKSDEKDLILEASANSSDEVNDILPTNESSHGSLNSHSINNSSLVSSLNNAQPNLTETDVSNLPLSQEMTLSDNVLDSLTNSIDSDREIEQPLSLNSQCKDSETPITKSPPITSNPTAKNHSYVPLSVLSDTLCDKASTCMPNIATLSTTNNINYITPSNKADLKRFQSPKIEPNVHYGSVYSTPSVKGSSNYVNEPIKCAIRPMPTMASEICEV